MTSAALMLILVSAILHAGWNLISKNEHPTAAFFLAANLLGCLLLSPILYMYGHALFQLPQQIWALIGLTGLCQAIYFVSLAGAYRFGAISIAYPLVRSSPIIVVTVVVLLLGRGDQVSGQSIGGIALVVIGSILLPMKKFSDIRLANYLNLSCLLGLLAAFGTAGYSIIDDEALRQIRHLPLAGMGVFEHSLLYVLLEGLSACLWLGLFVLLRQQSREAFVQVMRTRTRPTAITGLGINLTYLLVLISMAFVSNVSYVVAFRQISIPIGVALGVLLFNEPRHMPKFVATAIIFIGLILVGTG